MKKMQKGKRFNMNERGMVLVIVLCIIAVLILIGSTNVMTSVTDLKISSNYKLGTQAFYASEAGIEYAFFKLQEALQVINPTINISAPTVSGYTFDEFSVASLGTQTQGVMTGTYAGLTAYITQYRVISKARVNGTNAAAKVDLLVKDNLIPVFQFGIFYNDNLEMLPGANMTFTGGRIHSNKNIYLNADGGTLSIDSKMTSAGDIIHDHLDGRSHSSGTVQIKDTSGSYQTMNIDSNSSNWASQALSKWGGNVEDQDHGIKSINVPTTASGGNARDLIDATKTDSLYQQAGLRIIDGVAKDKDGNTLDIRSYDPTHTDSSGNLIIDAGGDATHNLNPLATKSFCDKRQKNNCSTSVTVTEVNIAKLQKSTAAMNALNSPPSGSDPGILYVNQTDNSKSVRLTEGASIPAAGLTVASNNPVYIKGDYNTANHPSAVLGDAVMILSNNWSDANSSSSLSSRTASATTVNAAIMAGNVPTPGGTSAYSGGVENFPRFLENWSGKTFTYGGSLVCLWQSNQATGAWGQSDVYNAPNRSWSYGINPASLPPGTPRVRYIGKLAWRHYIF